jgi:hypothetical protein
VRSCGQEFSIGTVTCGVPQGSVSFFHIYVSDFQRRIDELNLNLQRVHEWF